MRPRGADGPERVSDVGGLRIIPAGPAGTATPKEPSTCEDRSILVIRYSRSRTGGSEDFMIDKGRRCSAIDKVTSSFRMELSREPCHSIVSLFRSGSR